MIMSCQMVVLLALHLTCLSQPVKKVALIIGVRSYESVPPLQNSINDAKDVAEILRRKGFETIELIDPKSKREIQDAVRSYFASLQGSGNGVGLFFYSGHGMQVDGVNYLIPTQASPQIKADIDDQCVKLDYIMGAMEQAGNQLNIFILDACRNNPFRSFTRSAETGLSMVSAPKGSYVVYATKPGSVASDGNGRNGLFTSKLMKYMDEPDLNIEQVFKRVANDVSVESQESQRPWIASDYTGDFYFTGQGSSIPKKAPKEPRRSNRALTLVTINNKFGYADSTGALAIPMDYELADNFCEGLARIKRGKAWGFVDSRGVEIMVECDVLGNYSQGLAYFSKYGKYGFIDKNQKVAIPITYDQVTPFSKEGLAAVSLNARWGHINTQGEIVTPIKYLNVSEFKNGFARVQMDTKYSFVNTNGEQICRPFESVADFSSGAAVVRDQGKVGFIDETGKVFLQPQFDQADNFSRGFSKFRLNNKVGIVNRQGVIVIKPLYESIRDINDDFFAVKLNGKWGFVDSLGEVRIKPTYDLVSNFSEGLAAVKVTGVDWSFIDKSGKQVIPPFYDYAEAFEGGIAKVKRNGKVGFLDKTGTEIIPIRFDNADSFVNGICRVTLKGKVIYIDKTGSCVLGPCR